MENKIRVSMKYQRIEVTISVRFWINVWLFLLWIIMLWKVSHVYHFSLALLIVWVRSYEQSISRGSDSTVWSTQPLDKVLHAKRSITIEPLGHGMPIIETKCNQFFILRSDDNWDIYQSRIVDDFTYYQNFCMCLFCNKIGGSVTGWFMS